MMLGAELALAPDVSVDLAEALARVRSWEDDPATALRATPEDIDTVGEDGEVVHRLDHGRLSPGIRETVEGGSYPVVCDGHDGC